MNINNYFNRAAHSYDNYCQLQNQVGCELIRFIKMQQPQAQRIIDLGCGTGITTERLASEYHYSDFHAIDIASSLVMRAAERLKSRAITVYTMDFDKLNVTLLFDIVFSNMVLHWSTQLAETLKIIKHYLSENGTLAFSIPLTGTLDELKQTYSINQFYDYTTIMQLLHECGYAVLLHHKETITQSFNTTIDALTSIKKIGANHVVKRKHFGLGTKSSINKINITQLTYVIGYFIARKIS